MKNTTFSTKTTSQKMRVRKTCRICLGTNLEKILDLGAMPPANAFLKRDELKAKQDSFPLELYFCKDCTLVQLRHVVNPKILFGNYHYQTSASSPLVAHFVEMARNIALDHINGHNDLVVEIGSNDGILLEKMKSACAILGIDPSKKMARLAKKRGVSTLTAFFNKETAVKVLQKYGEARVIVANNVFAHIDDLHSVMEGINTLLSQNGVFIFETHWVGNLIDKGGYDQIYHEHLCYFSLHALSNLAKQFNLKILDVSLVKIHGESLRVTLGKSGTIKKSVTNFIKKEKKLGLNLASTFELFANKVLRNKKELVKLLSKLTSQKKMIIGYGAPAKGNTLLNYCGITNDTLAFITDTTPLKQNLFAPGSNIEIVSPKKIIDARPDYILLLSWNYASEILKKEASLRKYGVRFIIPVPEVKVV